MKKIIVLITSIILVISAATVGIIKFLNSEYYWNEIILKDKLEVKLEISSKRYDLKTRLKYYPQSETLNGTVTYDYSKNMKYYKALKKVIKHFDREDEAIANITVRNKDNFEIQQITVNFTFYDDNVGAEFSVPLKKEDARQIGTIKMKSQSKFLDFDKKDTKFLFRWADFIGEE